MGEAVATPLAAPAPLPPPPPPAPDRLRWLRTVERSEVSPGARLVAGYIARMPSFPKASFALSQLGIVTGRCTVQNRRYVRELETKALLARRKNVTEHGQRGNEHEALIPLGMIGGPPITEDRALQYSRSQSLAAEEAARGETRPALTEARPVSPTPPSRALPTAAPERPREAPRDPRRAPPSPAPSAALLAPATAPLTPRPKTLGRESGPSVRVIRPEPGLEAALRRKYQDQYAAIEAVLARPRSLAHPEATHRALSALRARNPRDPGAMLAFLIGQAIANPASVSVPLDDPRGMPILGRLAVARDNAAQLGDFERVDAIAKVQHVVGRRLAEDVAALEQLVPDTLPADLPRAPIRALAAPQAPRALPAPAASCAVPPLPDLRSFPRSRPIALPAPTAPTLADQLAATERELARPHLSPTKRMRLEVAAKALRGAG